MIEFSQQEKEEIVKKIQQYFSVEMDQEMGSFDAQFLLDFFSEQLGAYFYNQGLSDALKTVETKIDDISDSIYQLEKVTKFNK